MGRRAGGQLRCRGGRTHRTPRDHPGRGRSGRPRRALRPGRGTVAAGRHEPDHHPAAPGGDPSTAQRTRRRHDPGGHRRQRRRPRNLIDTTTGDEEDDVDERMADVAYAAGWALIRHAPDRVGRTVFRHLADHSWRTRDAGTRNLERNLRRPLGPGSTDAQLRALSKAGMRSYMRYFYEMFRLPAMGEEYILSHTRAVGVEVLKKHVRSGRGVVVALPHMGNWDHAGAWITLQGIPLTTIAQRLRPESLFRRFTTYRESLGMEVLPLTGGANTVGTLARRLRAGGLVCLLADRDVQGTGLEVD